MFKLFFKAAALMCAVTVLLIPFDNHSNTPHQPKSIKNICTATNMTCPRRKDTVRIMSYNILSDGIGFEGSPCANRSDGITYILNNISADVICLQEVSRGWFTEIKANTDLTCINSLETEIAGLMTAIFYNPNRVELIKEGDDVFNTGGDYRMRRAVWGVFRLIDTGEIFCVVNTHFNTISDDNNYSSVQAMELTKIAYTLKEELTCPVFIAGDFNARKRNAISSPSSAVYEILSSHLTDAINVAKIYYSGVNNSRSDSSVDHFFITDNVPVHRYVVMSNNCLLSLSDHFPIFIDASVN